jgi:hypothetical protein
MDIKTYFENFYHTSLRFYDKSDFLKHQGELYILLMVTIPLSLILYIFFSRGRHKILVDLGRGHTWLIKM